MNCLLFSHKSNLQDLFLFAFRIALLSLLLVISASYILEIMVLCMCLGFLAVNEL